MPIEFVIRPHDRLSLQELYGILRLRNQVFIVELERPLEEIDGDDLEGDTYHLMGKDNDRVVAYLRMHKAADGSVKIRRVVVAKEYRNQGVARALMEESIKWSRLENARVIKLGARIHLQKFYESLGFETVSDKYFHDITKVWHVDMVLTLAS